MLKIHKSVEAEQDLINIWSYTHKTWGDLQADNYLDGLQDTFQLLARNPLICRLREEFFRSVRIHTHKHHIVVYDVLPDKISVIRVLHKSMDIESQLDEDSI